MVSTLSADLVAVTNFAFAAPLPFFFPLFSASFSALCFSFESVVKPLATFLVDSLFNSLHNSFARSTTKSWYVGFLLRDVRSGTKTSLSCAKSDFVFGLKMVMSPRLMTRPGSLGSVIAIAFFLVSLPIVPPPNRSSACFKSSSIWRWSSRSLFCAGVSLASAYASSSSSAFFFAFSACLIAIRSVLDFLLAAAILAASSALDFFFASSSLSSAASHDSRTYDQSVSLRSLIQIYRGFRTSSSSSSSSHLDFALGTTTFGASSPEDSSSAPR